MSDNYKLNSIRKVAFYPDVMLEGKLEITFQKTNSKKYVYLVFDIDEVDNITEETDYWCYLFPFDEMYDNSKYIYEMKPVEAISVMIQMQEAWKKNEK